MCEMGLVVVPLVLLTGGGAGTWLWWRRRVKVDQMDVLTLTRKTVARGTGRNQRMPTAPLEVFRFMELDEDVCNQEPYSHYDMVSLVDYFIALEIPGDFNWQRAARTALVAANMKSLLPITDFMKRPESPVDPFSPLGGDFKVYSFLRDALSPLHLSAVGELINLAADSNPDMELASELCVKTYCRGEHEAALPHEVWVNIPEHLVLDEHLPRNLKGLDPDAAPAVVQSTAQMEYMPDVSFSNVGMPLFLNDWQVRCGQVFAVILNRLSANMMPDHWKPKEWCDMEATVQLTQSTPRIHTPGELVRSLVEDFGASVDMRIVTRITSFGKGMSVQQHGKWLHIPVAFPLRTGVAMLDNVTAKSSGRDEIATLMNHGELALRVSLPGKFVFRISWYQGIEGFTGWKGGNDVNLPWASSPEAEVTHSAWTTTTEFADAADMAAMVANASNRMADERHLPSGGYGYLGVCLDSVATIQAGLGQAVTMFPCNISGQAKTRMAQTYQEISTVMQKDESCGIKKRIAVLAKNARKGLLSMPEDLRASPTQMCGTLARIKASLPETSPFEIVSRTREDIDIAVEQYRKSGLAVA